MGAVWSLPAPGDIVWCRFPELPRRSPGPKPRPALVLEVTERQDGATVTVVYGTSQQLHRLSAGEFVLRRQSHSAAYQAAGLSYDTKFDFKQSIELPWIEEFFAVAVENYFERPEKFLEELPHFYNILAKILNQDPIQITKIS